MAKNQTQMILGSGSYVLEEPINVEYYIVGSTDWLDYSIPVSLKKKTIPIVSGFESRDLARIKAYLKKHKVHGMDTESGGPNPGSQGIKPDGLNPLSSTSELYLFQYGTQERTFVMEPRLIPFFREELESEDHLKINQNIIHDFKFLLKKYDVHMVRMFCTMLTQQMILAGIDGFKVGLQDLLRSYAPFRLISKGVRTEFANCGGKFNEAMLHYAARDVSELFGIFNGQCAELKRLKLLNIAKLEFDTIAPTAEMELTGVLLDKDVLQLTQEYYVKKMKLAEKNILRLFNEALKRCDRKERGFLDSLFQNQTEVFDINSSTEKMKALARIGILVENVQRSTLQLIGTELTLAMGEYTEFVKVVSTYGENMVAKIQPETGRMHPEFHQLGVGDFDGGKDKKETIATGRFSSDIQCLPKPETIFDTITDPEDLALLETQFAGALQLLRMKKVA